MLWPRLSIALTVSYYTSTLYGCLVFDSQPPSAFLDRSSPIFLFISLWFFSPDPLCANPLGNSAPSLWSPFSGQPCWLYCIIREEGGNAHILVHGNDCEGGNEKVGGEECSYGAEACEEGRNDIQGGGDTPLCKPFGIRQRSVMWQSWQSGKEQRWVAREERDHNRGNRSCWSTKRFFARFANGPVDKVGPNDGPGVASGDAGRDINPSKLHE